MTRPLAGHDSPGHRSRAIKLRTTDRGPRASSRSFVARLLRSVGSRRTVCVSASALVLLLVLPAVGLVHHVYFDRSGLPDLEPFIRFELPTIGQVYDTHGKVLVELATGVSPSRLLRRGASHPAPRHPGGRGQELLLPLRRGVPGAAAGGLQDGGALGRRLVEGRPQFRLRFPQGGSTLTQQLVRGYFLRDRTSRENGAALFRDTRDVVGSSPRAWASRPRTSSSGSWRRCA